MVRFLQRVNRQKRTGGKSSEDSYCIFIDPKGHARYSALNYFNHKLKRYSIFSAGHKNPENNEKGLHWLSLYIHYLHIRTSSLEIC